jgi:hypothetical protein
MNWLGFVMLFAFWAVVISALVYLARRGKLTYVNLLPYQRGILFRNGLPVKDVGPGKHRVWSGTELLVHADTRPVTVNYENQVVSLQDGFAALYGFSGSAQIRDLRKVLYCARDYTQVPAFTFLRCARHELNACTSGALKLNKDAVAQKISEDAKARLASSGFELLSFRLTQFAIGTVQAQPQGMARSTPPNQQN